MNSIHIKLICDFAAPKPQKYAILSSISNLPLCLYQGTLNFLLNSLNNVKSGFGSVDF
jgi:hypothetical protein